MGTLAPGQDATRDEPECYNCGARGHFVIACPEQIRKVPAGLEVHRARQASGNSGQSGNASHSRHSNGMVITRYGPPPGTGPQITQYTQPLPPPPPSHHSAPPGLPPFPPPPPVHHGLPPAPSSVPPPYIPPPQHQGAWAPPPAPGYGGPPPQPSYHAPPPAPAYDAYGRPMPPPPPPPGPPFYQSYQAPGYYGPPAQSYPPGPSAQSYPPGPYVSAPPPPPPPPQHQGYPPAPYSQPQGYYGPPPPSLPPNPYAPPNSWNPPPTHQQGQNQQQRHRGRNEQGRNKKGRRQQDQQRNSSQPGHRSRSPSRQPAPAVAPLGGTPEPAPVAQSEKLPRPNAEEDDDFQWELKAIFQTEERKSADPIGRPLPAEWNDDPTIPPAYNAKGIISEFFKVDNADEFCKSIRDTAYWDKLKFDPSFKGRNGMVLRHFSDHAHAIAGYPGRKRKNDDAEKPSNKIARTDSSGTLKTTSPDLSGQAKSSGGPEQPAPGDVERTNHGTNEGTGSDALEPAIPTPAENSHPNMTEKSNLEASDTPTPDAVEKTTLIRDVPPDVRDDWSPRIRAMKIAYGHKIDVGSGTDPLEHITEPVKAPRHTGHDSRTDICGNYGPLGKRDRSRGSYDERDTKRPKQQDDGYSRDRPSSRGHGSASTSYGYRNTRHGSPQNTGPRHDSGYHSAQSIDRGRPVPSRERPAERGSSSRPWQRESGRSSSGSKSRSRSRKRSRTPAKKPPARSPSVDSGSSSELDDFEYAMLGMVRPEEDEEEEEEEEEEERPKKSTKKTLKSSKALKLEAAKRRPQKVASAFSRRW